MSNVYFEYWNFHKYGKPISFDPIIVHQLCVLVTRLTKGLWVHDWDLVKSLFSDDEIAFKFSTSHDSSAVTRFDVCLWNKEKHELII